jgi:hypothetical protein
VPLASKTSTESGGLFGNGKSRRETHALGSLLRALRVFPARLRSLGQRHCGSEARKAQHKVDYKNFLPHRKHNSLHPLSENHSINNRHNEHRRHTHRSYEAGPWPSSEGCRDGPIHPRLCGRHAGGPQVEGS